MLENSDPWNLLEMWDIYWETVKKIAVSGMWRK